jgi:hypothetical protein
MLEFLFFILTFGGGGYAGYLYSHKIAPLRENSKRSLENIDLNSWLKNAMDNIVPTIREGDIPNFGKSMISLEMLPIFGYYLFNVFIVYLCAWFGATFTAIMVLAAGTWLMNLELNEYQRRHKIFWDALADAARRVVEKSTN